MRDNKQLQLIINESEFEHSIATKISNSSIENLLSHKIIFIAS